MAFIVTHADVGVNFLTADASFPTNNLVYTKGMQCYCTIEKKKSKFSFSKN